MTSSKNQKIDDVIKKSGNQKIRKIDDVIKKIRKSENQGKETARAFASSSKSTLVGVLFYK